MKCPDDPIGWATVEKPKLYCSPSVPTHPFSNLCHLQFLPRSKLNPLPGLVDHEHVAPYAQVSKQGQDGAAQWMPWWTGRAAGSLFLRAVLHLAWTRVWQRCLEPRAAESRAEPSRTCHLLLREIKSNCRVAASGSEVICGHSSSGRAADSPENACWHTSSQAQMSKPTPDRFWCAGNYHLNYK